MSNFDNIRLRTKLRFYPMLYTARLCLSLPLLLAVFSVNVLAQQVVIEDDFSDGNFTENPSWSDPNNRHIVNASNELQLNAPAESDTAVIVTPSTAAFGEWEFLVRFDFNPSSTSFSRIYLVADTPDLKGAVNGYFVRVGHTDDEVSLFRQDGTDEIKIINGTDDLIDNSSVTVRIRVTRTTDGSWELLADPSGTQNFVSQGTIQDNTYTIGQYFGFFSKYIGSRSTLYFYDDVLVTKQTPPLVAEFVQPITNSILEVPFNIPLNENSVEPSDFLINNGIGIPQQVSIRDERVVTLQFDDPIPGGDYELTIANDDIEDSDGNTLAEDVTLSFTLFDFFEAGNIVINEFMYDPPTGLAEYVELRNASSKTLNLQNWQLEDENIGDDIITSDTLVMEPNSFMVISRDTSALSAVFGTRNYVQMTNLSALNNGGDQIQLITSDGRMADSLAYTPDWGGNDVALERRDAGATSTAIENWGDSPAPEGGTPGQPNLVSSDSEPPSLTGLSFPNSETLKLAFSETLDPTSSQNDENYSISGDPQVVSAALIAPDTVALALAPPMIDNTAYTISIRTINDLFGNTLSSIDTAFTFFEISEAEPGDVLITEFMYDPPDGFTEFIELQNISTKSIDLDGWTFNDATGNPSSITNSSVVLPPGQFIVIAPDNTLLEQFPDINLIDAGSRFSSLNNSGDQIKMFKSDSVPMDSLLYDDSWGGNDVSLERRSTQVSAIFQANWGDSPSEAGATPGAANGVEPDNQPPNIASFTVVDARNLQIQFSEQVFNADDISQYSFEPDIAIQNVDVQRDTVFITLAADLISGNSFTLNIRGITDLFGNEPDQPLTQSFTFFETELPTPGSLFINEFMYDPPDGYTEYVELLNTSDVALDLNGVMFNDNRGSPGILSNLGNEAVLPAGQRIVLVPDSTLIQVFPESDLLVIGSAFQNLNNGGDAIIISDREGITLDSLLYTTSWGGDEVALERRTTDVAAIFRENWENSPSPDLGTPGLANLVPPDETPPQLLSVEALTDTRLQLTLSEQPDVNSATDPATYQLSPSRSIQMVIVDGATVELILSQPLVTDQEFTLTVQNLEDLFGNRLASSSQTFELFRFQQARPGDVVINEILYRKAVNSDVEFVELFNRSDRDIDLNLWRIGDSGGNPSFIDAPGQVSIIPIPSNEFVVLTNDENFADTTDNFIAVSRFPSLNDEEDAVFNRDGQGRTIDSLFYSSTWGGSKNGFSLERIDPFGASNDRSNWRTSEADLGITPGRQNSVLQVDDIPPQPNFATLQTNGQILILFDEFIQQTEELAIQVAGSPVAIITFDRANADRIIVEGVPVDTASNPQVEVRNLIDFRGNVTDLANIPLSLPAKPGEMVFNEIMYDPITPDRSDDPSQSEYLEIINRSNHAISLEGMTVFEERLSDGSLDGVLDIVETQGKFIPAGRQFLVYADPAERFQDSRINRFFGLDSLQFFTRVDATSLRLKNTGQPVILADSTGITIDSLVYDPEWHNPNLVDTKGISLERKVPGGASNDSRNWGSASTNAVPEGGTPGFQNTLFAPSEDLEQQNSITLQPNPFSPNDDGRDDNLVIDYNLSETDFLLRVRIYDRYGREVRTLADGEPAGRTGTLVWDGLDDNGRKNRIGYYIVYFEAFNSANGTNQVFKKTVVLARQL